MSESKKNLLSNTEVLLQKILDKLDDIYTVQEAMLEILEESHNMATQQRIIPQLMVKRE